MNISFSVAMMLQAVNNMGPGIRSAQNMMQNLGQTAKNVARQTSSLNPVQGWDAKIKQATEQLKNFQKSAGDAQKKFSDMQKNGFENMATGAAIGLPVLDFINKAADRQRSQMVLMEAGMGAKEVEAVTQQAKNLSQELMFGVNELMTIPLAMQRAGMNADKIQTSFRQIAYMAELEHLRTGDSAYNISKQFAQMAEQARVTQDPEALRQFAEAVNRVATVTTASMSTLSESSKYFTIIAKDTGISPEDIMMHQGFMARMGLEGTVGGTNLKDFYQRINPWYHERIGGSSKEALADMEALGWITDSTTTVMKSGREKFLTPGQSIFFDESGAAKPFIEVAKLLTDSYKNFIAVHGEAEGRLQYRGYVKNIVGQEGLQTAMALTDHMDMVDKMYEDYKKVQLIETSIHQFQTTWTQTFESFKSNLENIGVDIVTQSMQDLTKTLKDIRPYVDSFGKWVKNNQGVVTTVTKAALAVSLFLITLGATKIVLGTIGKLMLGGFMFGIAPITWILRFMQRLMDLKVGFDLLRETGAGFWRSLWQGAQLAFPWLGRISGWVGRFTPMWLTNAARIAAGWIIAMGPVGWIILGVSAIIAAGVWAWNTNFMGFRDKCIAAWNMIHDWGSQKWSSITGFVSSAIDRVSGYIDRVKEALRLSQKMTMTFTGPVRGVNLDSGETPFVGGGNRSNTNNVTQNVSVNVPSTDEANRFVANLDLPGKYTDNDYNPSFSW